MILRTRYIITLTSVNVKLGAQEIIAGPYTPHCTQMCTYSCYYNTQGCFILYSDAAL